MNDMAGISPATKHRVLQAARELQYRPSRFGRGLVNRGTPTLGLVVVDLKNSFWAELASRVLDEAYEQGWTVLIAESSHDVRAAVENLLPHVDAVFGLVAMPRPDLDEAFGPIPLLHFETGLDHADRPCIHLDFADAMEEAVGHLIGRGRRRIVMLDWALDNQFSDRALRFEDATAASGVGEMVLHAATTIEPDMEAGRSAVGVALRQWPDLDAVVCFNDAVAVGAMKQLQEWGKRVPEDVSVVGIDGSSLGAAVTPELTTLRVDLTSLARSAIEMVIGMVDGRVPARRLQVQLIRPHLVVRRSS